MLLFLISLLVSIIVIVIAGFKLANKLKDLEIKLFFWILYGISVFTLALLGLCIYIFVTFRKKTGALGPRGFQGIPGDEGDPGSCDQNLCRSRTLAILIEKKIEEFNQDPPDDTIKNKICGFVLYRDSLGNHQEIIKKWSLIDVKIFRDTLVKVINNISDSNIYTILQKTIEKFNKKVGPEKKFISTDNYRLCKE